MTSKKKLSLSPAGKMIPELQMMTQQSGVIKLKECGKISGGGKRILKLDKNHITKKSQTVFGV